MSDSIFKLSTYVYDLRNKKRALYPCFMLREGDAVFFRCLNEAEEYIRAERVGFDSLPRSGCPEPLGVYAYVVTELPLGVPVNTTMRGESLSERVYLPDGTLWMANDYCNFIPHTCHTPDQYNAWGQKGIFLGRNPEEIRFKPGDIVEVLGIPGNPYWGDGEVNLAMVVSAPQTKEALTKEYEEYIATHNGFDICAHNLCRTFGHERDTYEVVSLCCDSLDHSPTYATLAPRMPVPTKTLDRLKKAYNKL